MGVRPAKMVAARLSGDERPNLQGNARVGKDDDVERMGRPLFESVLGGSSRQWLEKKLTGTNAKVPIDCGCCQCLIYHG